MRGVILATALTLTRPIPIGVADHNPGNILSTRPSLWPGAVGCDPYGHLVFMTDVDGIRGIRRVLRGYWRKHHLHTIRAICHRWASRDVDTPEKLRERLDYAKKVAWEAHLGLDEPVDMTDGWVLFRLAKGIVYAEEDYQPYPDALFKEALGLAGDQETSR